MVEFGFRIPSTLLLACSTIPDTSQSNNLYRNRVLLVVWAIIISFSYRKNCNKEIKILAQCKGVLFIYFEKTMHDTLYEASLSFYTTLKYFYFVFKIFLKLVVAWQILLNAIGAVIYPEEKQNWSKKLSSVELYIVYENLYMMLLFVDTFELREVNIVHIIKRNSVFDVRMKIS